MSAFAIFAITILGASIGFLVQVAGFTSPALFWAIGSITGALAMAVAFVIKFRA